MNHGPSTLGRAAIASAAAALLLGSGCARNEPDRPDLSRMPDVILVAIDSLRPDHLGCYGYSRNTSPAIDAIAEGGVLCSNAVSTTSWTLPAHCALFTGLYDFAHGVTEYEHTLASNHVTLAEILRDAGYQTAGFYGGPFLHPTFGLDQGFSTYQSCMTTLEDNASAETVRRESHQGRSRAHADITGPRTLHEFRKWLDGAEPERPFFVFLHMWDVHYDYIPPAKYIAMFDPGYTGSIAATNFYYNKAIGPDMASRDLEHIIALYDGEIRFTDDILGDIFDALAQSGRLTNTLIVITADHGDEFFEHAGKGHGLSLYDEVIRVPLIFRWPGRLPAGTTIDTQVRLIDIMPTILGLIDMPADESLQGEDISPLLRGEQTADLPALCELVTGTGLMTSLRTDRNKLVMLEEGRLRKVQYFDLLADPLEQTPAPAITAEADQAAREIDRLRARCFSIYEQRVRNSGHKSKIDNEMKARLRSLGYIGGE